MWNFCESVELERQHVLCMLPARYGGTVAKPGTNERSWHRKEEWSIQDWQQRIWASPEAEWGNRRDALCLRQLESQDKVTGKDPWPSIDDLDLPNTQHGRERVWTSLANLTPLSTQRQIFLKQASHPNLNYCSKKHSRVTQMVTFKEVLCGSGDSTVGKAVLMWLPRSQASGGTEERDKENKPRAVDRDKENRSRRNHNVCICMVEEAQGAWLVQTTLHPFLGISEQTITNSMYSLTVQCIRSSSVPSQAPDCRSHQNATSLSAVRPHSHLERV